VIDIAALMLADEPGFRRVTVAAVIKATARHYGVAQGLLTERDGMSGSRERWIVRKRQVAMYLSRELTDASLCHIGALFGHRDHATVIHACRAVKERLADDPFTRADVRAIMKSLGAIELPGMAA
jgi:chromosomal replication initiator protein